MNEIMIAAGFTPEETEGYRNLEKQFGSRVYSLVKTYMDTRDCHISQFYDPLREIAPEEADLLGAMLLFVMEGARLRAAALQGHKKELFLQSLTDISCKMLECQAYKKAQGVFVMNWYHGLLKNWRPTLGRLEYEVSTYSGEDISVGDFTLAAGDKHLQCHIPSNGGPLTRENCLASLKMAWEEFPEFRKQGLLPVLCHSWLFYPPYEKIFCEGTGVGMFRGLWHMYKAEQYESFTDCWRIFSMDMPEDPDNLPQNTRMQRDFVSYIKAGGDFGGGFGILLFDGEKIL